MATPHIKYKRKKYTINEPTIENYSRVMKLKDVLEQDELYIRMICELTEMTRDEVVSASAKEFKEVGELIFQYFTQGSKDIRPIITHNGTTYKMIDTNKITFGQFVDIDTFLGKDEMYKINNLHELAAYIYTEDGVEYKDSDFNKRIQAFKDLPVKYIHSAVFFLVSLGRLSLQLTQIYSRNRLMGWWMKTMIRLASTGAGMPQFLSYLMMILARLTTLLTLPLLVASTTLHTYWTSINKKRKKQTNKTGNG